eukprot:365555-Chlamydomonas_euryale.AAC.16
MSTHHERCSVAKAAARGCVRTRHQRCSVAKAAARGCACVCTHASQAGRVCVSRHMPGQPAADAHPGERMPSGMPGAVVAAKLEAARAPDLRIV